MRMRRIRYTKTEGGLPKHVNYHFDEQGQEIFEERSVDEAHFHQYTPSEEECRVARDIRDEGNRPDRRIGIHYEGALLVIDCGTITHEPD
jgi:hypothetical protein